MGIGIENPGQSSNVECHYWADPGERHLLSLS